MGRNNIGLLLNQASDILRKERKISVARLAIRLGYRSPEYFKRSVLLILQEMLDCIVVEGNTVAWECSEVEAVG